MASICSSKSTLVCAGKQQQRSAVARPMAAVMPSRSINNCASHLAIGSGVTTRSRTVCARVSTTNGATAAAGDATALPVVKIDNRSDAFATIVTVEFGDRLGELLDTITALKNLGLNIRRAKLDGSPGRQANTFYITDATTSEKITRSAQIEEVRMTIINNMLYYHPEAGESLAAGQAAARRAAAAPSRDLTAPLGAKARAAVQTTIEVREAPNGSCSICRVSTADRPGLLVDIVSVLKDINVNVVSAEIDTIGGRAEDELFVTYHGEPLNGPMVQLVTNALQYYLSIAEVAKEESY